jgi:hypothetical protein
LEFILLNLHYEDQPFKYTIFEASATKVERARAFIAEAETEIARYLATNPVPSRLDTSVVPPLIRFSIIPPGPTLGAIIGDAVHNLRTALDLMASEMARLNENSDKDVYFPFSSAEETFDKRIKGANFDRCGPDAVEMIRQFAPYKGGNIALRAIHDLDIADKHTALIPTVHLPTIKFQYSWNMDTLEGAGTTIMDSTKVIFPKESVLFEREVIETLKEFVEIVEDILKAFSAMLLKRGSFTLQRSNP